MSLVEDLSVRCDYITPWAADERDWHGRVISVDTANATREYMAPAKLPPASDLAEILHAASSGEMWDGIVAAIVRLTDGRFLTWETFYGPTGHGFSEDAYGGDADVWITDTLGEAIALGLTDDGRRLLGLAS